MAQNNQNTNQDSIAEKIIYVASLLVFVFLIWLIYFKPEAQSASEFINYIPFINALFNTITATLLVFGFLAIKNGNKIKHVKFMISAAISSALFLIGYIIYHHFKGDTKFVNPSPIKYVYFFILITHVLFSIVQVPMIFLTFYHAFRKNWDRHKKIARITFPIWLYVSVTGVLVFIFLKLFN